MSFDNRVDTRVSKSLNVDSILARQNDGMPILPVLSSSPAKGMIAYDTATNGTIGWPFIADGTAWRPIVLAVPSLAGTGLTLVIGPPPVLSITPTGVVPGVYGSNTQIPQITVNAQGQITNIVNVPAYPQVGCQMRFGAAPQDIIAPSIAINVFGYEATDIPGFTLLAQPLFTHAGGIFTCTAAGVYDLTTNVHFFAVGGVGPYVAPVSFIYNGVTTLNTNWPSWPAGDSGITLKGTLRLAVGDTLQTVVSYTVPASTLVLGQNTSVLFQRIYN
jgi:hypothetical protein